MWMRWIYLYLVHLLFAAASGKVYINIINGESNSTLNSFGCYDDLIRDISNKLDMINLNLRLQMNKLSQKFDEKIIDIRMGSSAKTNFINTDLAKPTSCSEAMTSDSKSGIYEVYLQNSGLKPFNVFCLKDPDGGSAWTVILRRQYNSTQFYRGWHEYKKGFGDLEKDFFIGLEKLHALTTKAEPQELWVDLEDFEDKKRYAKYESFAIGDENSNYVLKVLGEYSGTAGDAMAVHQGMGFSTKDCHNDKSKTNCAVLYKGAWWFEDCHNAHLNGPYIDPGGEKGKGVNWFTWHTHDSLRFAIMAIRPSNKQL